jgi:hypothetical protein
MLGFVASAGAVDGVIEINQAKVLAAGGFPYVITSTGSYRLTSNLTVSAAATDAIDLNAPNITLDLNGFTISSTVATSANAISFPSVVYSGTTVENGTVTGFGRGVSVGVQSIVRNVHADYNSNVGIGVAANSVVQGCTANFNGNYGIVATGPTVISGNTANSQAGLGIGIYVEANGNGSLVVGNVASLNGGTEGDGIYLGNAFIGYRENTMFGNSGVPVMGGTSLGNNLCGGTVC